MAPRQPIRIVYRHGADGWWCESPDVPGWSGAADSYTEIIKLAKDGIAFALGEPIGAEHRDADAATPRHLAGMIARGEVRPGSGIRHCPNPVRGRKGGKSASEYVSEGRR